MAQYKVITPEMLATKGQVLSIRTTPIEPYHLWSYVGAVEDPNPLWADPEQARQSKYLGLIAPPGIFVEMQLEGGIPHWPVKDPLPYTLDGGGEWWFYKPVRVGDTITAIRKMADFQEKEGTLGTMVLGIFEVEYFNQRNELVAKGRWTRIAYG